MIGGRGGARETGRRHTKTLKLYFSLSTTLFSKISVTCRLALIMKRTSALLLVYREQLVMLQRGAGVTPPPLLHLRCAKHHTPHRDPRQDVTRTVGDGAVRAHLLPTVASSCCWPNNRSGFLLQGPSLRLHL